MASTSGSFMDHSFNLTTALSARRQLHLLSQPLAKVTVGVGVAEVDVGTAGLRLSLAVRPRMAGLAGVWAAAAIGVGPVVTRPLEAGAGWGRGRQHMNIDGIQQTLLSTATYNKSICQRERETTLYRCQ